MKEEPENRQSNLSDADLVADCTKRLVALRRDQAALADDGVTPARLDTFEADVLTLHKMPADKLDEQEKAVENQKRDGAMDDLRTVLRAVRGPVEDAYGDRSPQYKMLGLDELADMNEADLLKAGVTCAAAGARHLTDPKVVAEGLTQARLDAIAPAAKALTDIIGARDGLVMDRSLNAQGRVRQHNKIHKECATLCAKGFRKFEKTDPKRADDYIRDPAPGADTPPPVAPQP